MIFLTSRLVGYVIRSLEGTTNHLGMEPLGHVIWRSVSNLESFSAVDFQVERKTSAVKKHSQEKTQGMSNRYLSMFK